MPRSYYTILGVPETASLEEIQQAHRHLAKLYHPDRAGDGSAGAFREVQEAWETLSDRQRRRDHDALLRRQRATRPTAAGPRRPTPTRSPARGRGRTDRPLHLDLKLSAAEVLAGAEVALDLPVVLPCEFCDGRGGDFWFGCPVCKEQGWRVLWQRCTLRVAPGMRHGQVVEVPLHDPGSWYSRLVIRVRVEG